MVSDIYNEGFKVRVGIITEARMTSSRLPGKHLLEICGKPVFQILVDQFKKSEMASSIILATTINKEDDILCELAEELGIQIYRGSEDNVFERVIGAAVSHKIDIIAQITADCPLVDPNLIDIVVRKFLEGNHDYVGNTVDRQFADGLDVGAFSTNFLRSTYSPKMDEYFLEHVTAHIINSDEYVKYNIQATPEQYGPDLRITLDTETDYQIIKKVYTKLINKNLEINCENVTSLLK